METASRTSILIVDDVAINRALLRALFKSTYSILEAENGMQALTLLRTHKDIAAMILDLFMPVLDGIGVLTAMRDDEQLSAIPVLVVTAFDDEESQMRSLELGAMDVILKPYNPQLIRARLKNAIERLLAQRDYKESERLKLRLEQQRLELERACCDELTGLRSGSAFSRDAAALLRTSPPGRYAICCFDIDGFNAINDQYGRDAGNKLLRHVAHVFNVACESVGGFCGRLNADNFVAVYPREFIDSPALSAALDAAANMPEPPVNAKLSMGCYVAEDLSLSMEAMQDRAMLAKKTVKGRYDVRHTVFNETLREQTLWKQEIVSQMAAALAARQFELWMQPQYNHANGECIGAEALVRWQHPVNGLMPPGLFIDVFEENGFIYALDRFIWEQSCAHLRRRLDMDKMPRPVSVNISRYDIFQPDFFEIITSIVERYTIPVDLLRLEITESAFARSAEQIIAMVKRLQAYGFCVEIDDFGSGYSSLNLLKAVPADVLKLDMRFLEDDDNAHRGGRILESVIRMAKWLDMPVIAEGVETRAQADYLRTLGCEYIQGYLYAKPMPLAQYEALLDDDAARPPEMRIASYLGGDTFWNPDTIETMVFNRFSGGACVFEYWNGHFEILRVNERFASVFHTDLTPGELLKRTPFSELDEADHRCVIAAVEQAADSGATVPFEIRSSLYSPPGHSEYIRFSIRLIATNEERFLFYAYVENVSAQRLAQRLQAVLVNAPGALVCLRVEGEALSPVFVSPTAGAMLNVAPEALEKDFLDSVYARVDPQTREALHTFAQTLLTQGNVCKLSCRILRGDGGARLIELCGRASTGEQGERFLNIYCTEENS